MRWYIGNLFESLLAFNMRSIKYILYECACALKRDSFIISISAYRQKLSSEPGLFLGKTIKPNQVSCYNVKWKYKDAWLFCVKTNRFILSSVFFYHLKCDILEWGSWHIMKAAEETLICSLVQVVHVITEANEKTPNLFIYFYTTCSERKDFCQLF